MRKTTMTERSYLGGAQKRRSFIVALFCEGVSGELHRASTFNLDHNVRESAHILNDTALLGKLSAGDMVALDAVYHTQCLSKLYKRAVKMKNQLSTPTDECSEVPNDSFLPNALKHCFRLSGVLLKLCRLILGCAIKFLSVRFF